MRYRRERRHRRWVALAQAAVVAILLVVAQSSVSTQSVTGCPAADPYDTVPDDEALQNCLAQFDRVLLQAPTRPGYVGYLVTDR